MIGLAWKECKASVGHGLMGVGLGKPSRMQEMESRGHALGIGEVPRSEW